MIELTEQADQEALSRVDELLQRISGHPREFPVHHQVLNWLMFINVFFVGSAGIENALLGIQPFWQLLTASAVFGVCYYITRFKRRWVVPIAILSVAIWLPTMVVSWFTSNGLLGGTSMWMLIGLVFLSLFRDRRARALVVGLWLLELAALIGIQLADPSLVMPYSSARVGYIDMAFSVVIIALYLIGYVLILSYNLEKRRQQADELLLNILPRRIAEQLEYSSNKNVAEHVQDASVLFADVVSFTPMTADMAASELIGLLNEVFSAFDNLVEQRGLEKIKTIGDCYMVAAGVPESRDDHACVLADLALAMQQYVTGRLFKGKELSFRIGINSGPLVAGVIGRKKFIYDLWGDTVNTASRTESHGVAGRVQVTESTRSLIEREFCVEPRGVIPVKGKGEMPVWFVTGRKAALS